MLAHLLAFIAACRVIFPVSAPNDVSSEFVVSVFVLALQTTMSSTTEPIPVSEKMRPMTTRRGRMTTDMLRVDLSAAHPRRILVTLQHAAVPTGSDLLHVRKTGSHGAGRLGSGHGIDSGISKSTTVPNNAFFRRTLHYGTCRYGIIHLRTVVIYLLTFVQSASFAGSNCYIRV